MTMRRLLVTGTNRGLGLEFVRQCLARGDRVFAACRHPEQATSLQDLLVAHPEQLTILRLEVTDEATVDASLEIVRSLVDGLDLLINSAGVFPRDETPATLDGGTMLHAFHVNAVAPLIITQRFLGLLRAGTNPVVVNIASMMASPANKQEGGDYSYCASKAALLMLTRALAFDLRPEGIVAVLMFPGWVPTDMSLGEGPLPADESIRGMLQVIEGLTAADVGKFYRWDGSEHPF